VSVRLRALCAASSLALIAVFAGGARAQSVAYNAPNVINVPGATSVSLGGSSFVNQGLVGTARLPADLHDFNGETLGSFSGMAIDLSTWRRNSDGSYSASLFTLPDRGPNNIGGFTTTDYAARLNKFTFSLRPNAGGAVAANVQQATLTQSGGFLLRDTTGAVFTGRDPQAGVVVRGGIAYPTPLAGDPGFGKIALDAEAVTFLADGSFYVGDEYAAGIYYFDASGRQIGAIQANPDLLPRVNGLVNFNGTNDSPLVAGTTGRRSNQGMEGISVSPDGTRLFAVLQSAPLQDNPTNVAVRRNNTRVLVYDISATRTPTAPINEYVLQLPVFNNSATGTGNATATAAQSEVLALNNTQFLVLSRDGNGRGTNGNANAIAYKSILLVDIAGATDIAGTPYSGTTPISTTAASNLSGALVPGITPVQQVELVNMLNAAQLASYGVNLNPAPSTQYTLSEKWEAMALAPVLDEAKPNDFFLLVGNDNDFVSADIDAAGVTNANAALNSATAGTGNNDNVVMVYRLTLPTYIDPQALAWLKRAAPIAMAATRTVGAEFAAAGPKASIDTLDLVRRAHFSGVDVGGFRAWAQGGWRRVGGQDGRTDGGDVTVGLETGSNRLRAGVAVTGSDYQGRDDELFRITGHGFGVSVYGAVYDPSGFYVEGAIGVSRLKLRARRPASYGLFAQGATDGDAVFGELQAGYSASFGPFRAGPYVDAVYGDIGIDSYQEHGAAIGNGAIPTNRYKRGELTLGLEATFARAGAIRPTLRAGYTMVGEAGLRSPTLALAAVQNSATVVALPGSEHPFARIEGALEGEVAGLSWRLGAELRDTRGETSGRVVVGVAKRF
jgi:hypothetical protein